MLSAKILIIDSGIGGLSVCQNILQLLPESQVYYIADQQFFPYGERGDANITRRVCDLVDFARQRFAPQLAVIACNTASTVALEALRMRFAFPFVGVVPAIKPAAALTRNGHIAVLATAGTVNRSYTQRLIEDFASHCHVSLIAAPSLVKLAESKMIENHIAEGDVRAALSGLYQLEQKPDTAVLACTHFPLLKNELAQAFADIDNWVDSGAAIARRVQQLVNQSTSLGESLTPPRNTLCITGKQARRYSTQQLERYLPHFEIEQAFI